MTRTQILALPTQTENRLIFASDANQFFAVRIGTTGADAIPMGIGTSNTIALDDTPARLTVASYDATGGPVVGSTKVIQDDTPDIVWSLVAEDATQTSSWRGQPLLNPAGEIVGPLIGRASSSGDVPAWGELVVAGGSLGVGNDYEEQGVRMATQRYAGAHRAAKRPGDIVMDIDKASGTYLFTAKSTTGYSACQWWDGIVEVAGFGVESIAASFSKAIPAIGTAWGGPAVKRIRFWPSDAAGLPAGEFSAAAGSTLSLGTGDVVAISLRDCKANWVSLTGYRGADLDLTGCSNMTILGFTGTKPNLTHISMVGADSLTNVSLPDCPLKEIDLHAIPASAVDVSGTDLEYLDAGVTTIDYLDVEGSKLYGLGGVGFGGVFTGPALYLSDNNLTTDAIYEFLAQISPLNDPLTVELEGNPCDNSGSLAEGAIRTAAETISMATTKNCTLIFVKSR